MRRSHAVWIASPLLLLALGCDQQPLSSAQASTATIEPASRAPGTTLIARLLDADGKSPIAGVRVTLAASTTEEERSFLEMTLAPRKHERAAKSAADGTVRFDSVAPGNYELRAEVTPRLVADEDPVSIVRGEAEKHVDLVLPPNGWLVGRILGFEQAPFEGCSLLVVHEWATRPRARSLFMQKTLLNPIAADGSFRAGPLLAGKSSVQLQYAPVEFREDRHNGSTRTGPTEEFGDVEVPAGAELHLDFDLRGKVAGRVEANLRVPGVKLTDVFITIMSDDDRDRTGVIDLDSNGVGRSGAIPAGPVHFRIADRRDKWDWFPPGKWSIASGQTLQVEWDVPLVSGTLKLIEAETGVALGGRTAWIGSGNPGFLEDGPFDADEHGRIQLQRVRGNYHLRIGKTFGKDGTAEPSPYQELDFDWVESLVLKVAKKP